MSNLFMIDLMGLDISEEEKMLLQHPNVGGLLLFTRNMRDRDQLKRLVAAVHTLRPDIFIAVDHEGGNVQRFQRQGFRALPAARVYGDVFDIHPATGIALAQQYGEAMARDVLDVGIDLSLGPVLDLHGISHVIAGLDRAFHASPLGVVALAGAWIQGMHQAGMPAVGKHFPGHGSVLSDSHVAMPVLEQSKTQLMQHDLKPFIDLINNHLLDGLMPAHVTYPAVDAAHAAGFSKIWLQDVLRQELQFDGFVLSDCLGMVGADIGDMQTRANQALEAGCDMIIVGNQSRSLLAKLLQTVTFKPSLASQGRMEAFKQKMRRFSLEIRSCAHPFFDPTSRSTTPPESQTHTPNASNGDILNNTKSV